MTSKQHRWMAHFVAPANLQRNEDRKYTIDVPQFEDDRFTIIDIRCVDCLVDADEYFGTPCLADQRIELPNTHWRF